MFWIFATTVLILAVHSPGFRKGLKWTAIGIAGLWLLLYVIGAVLG